MKFQKKILNVLHPLLRRLSFWYLSKPRACHYRDLSLTILPGVFHPQFFFSSEVMCEYIEKLPLDGLRILDLGTGSGILALLCARRRAVVTASDISSDALRNADENARLNRLPVKTVLSDVFEKLDPSDFDLILVNPPYYPRNPRTSAEHAWYCGENFQYFEKLFSGLSMPSQSQTTVFMILAEGCDFSAISAIASRSGFSLLPVYHKEVFGEVNTIYRVKA